MIQQLLHDRYWPITELIAAWERPQASSAYRLEAVIGSASALRAASDPLRHMVQHRVSRHCLAYDSWMYHELFKIISNIL